MEQVISSTGKKDIGVANRRKFITKLTWLIAGGMFVDGFVLGYVGMVMPAITQELNLSLTWQGLIGAAALIGIFFGSPLGGMARRSNWASSNVHIRSHVVFGLFNCSILCFRCMVAIYSSFFNGRSYWNGIFRRLANVVRIRSCT